MFEDVTFESIMEGMLERVPSWVDKREGSVIWDALAPAAMELQNLYVAIDTVMNETFADTASLYYLKRRAAERGIEQIMATNAIVQGEFTPADLDIPVGSRFSCENLNYAITEKVSDGVFQLTCETAGAEGNNHLGTLIPIDYIAGLETAQSTKVLIPAEDDEDVESLRERYMNSITSQACGGNIADYIAKTIVLDGVGGVKVTPVWNGGGTVKLTILDDGYSVPTPELIASVKEAADPYSNEGKGYGFAPIGHVVTVEGVSARTINIVTEITYASGWSWDTAASYIRKAVDDLFLEMAEGWDAADNLIVRISQIESRILSCEGVLDISGTKLNGSTANISLSANEIPVRGTINGN